MSLTFASWNQIGEWLRRLKAFRQSVKRRTVATLEFSVSAHL